MTDNLCRCGLRLSVLDVAGVCLSCQELPLRNPMVYTEPSLKQGDAKCVRCGNEPRLPQLSYGTVCRRLYALESYHRRKERERADSSNERRRGTAGATS